MLRRIPFWLLGVSAAALVSLFQLPFWVLTVARRLAYPYPIDYGEGPLLRQLNYVLHGGSLAGVYGDLQVEPFVVVNYPPLYLTVSRLLAVVLPALTAGRVVSALAGLAAGVAVWLLARPLRDHTPAVWVAAALTALGWYAIPIVREWSAVMRVDMLGVAVGLVGLVLAQRGRVTWGSVLVALALLAKPTLIAAPLALLVLYVTVPRQAALRALAIAGGVVLAIVALFSLFGADLWLHVVQANVNGWEYALAKGFWRELLTIHWPLLLVAGLGALLLARVWRQALAPEYLPLSMALAYTAGGVVVGIGIGKVGAYANYFLELYAGLIWVATCLVVMAAGAEKTRQRWLAVALVALCNLAVLRFYPLWSETYPKPYGMIEQQRPPRLVVGGYGVLQDYRREGQILAANAVTNADLTTAIRAAGTEVYTDMPAIAAQADVRAPMQVFEHRQLLDAGLWDQKPLLRRLANGEIPIVVLDYLGNWMTPESIALITTRYAQSGSRGSYDVYQPIATGAPSHVEARFGTLVVDRLAIAAPMLQPAYEPGSTVPVVLRFSGSGDSSEQTVTLQLTDSTGATVAQSRQTLFAGALSAADLAAGPLEHLQALRIPRRVGAGTYTLAVSIDAAAPIAIGILPVAPAGGVMRGEPAYLIPAAFMAYIAAHGGENMYGIPHMPAMPFAEMTIQCFTTRCLILPTGSSSVEPAPLGEWLRGATALLPPAVGDDAYHFERVIAQSGLYEGTAYAPTDQARSDGATSVWLRREVLLRFDDEVVTVADGGVRLLRLPGIPYRWGVER